MSDLGQWSVAWLVCDFRVLYVPCLESRRTPQLASHLFTFYRVHPPLTVLRLRTGVAKSNIPRSGHRDEHVGQSQAGPIRAILLGFPNLKEGSGRFPRRQTVRREPGAVCGHIHIQTEEAELQQEQSCRTEKSRGRRGEESPSWQFQSLLHPNLRPSCSP